jgi:3-isopropylmalate dehydrogenase
MSYKARILVLAGDDIGPEVVEMGVAVLRNVAETAGIVLELQEDMLGGAAYDRHGVLPRRNS